MTAAETRDLLRNLDPAAKSTSVAVLGAPLYDEIAPTGSGTVTSVEGVVCLRLDGVHRSFEIIPADDAAAYITHPG